MSKIVPLFLTISPGDPRPIVRQITDGIRMAIASGELPVGGQLPSVRGLAQQLTVNPKTVAKAYSDLVAEGWLNSSQGLGLFVAAPRQRLSDSERERRLNMAIEALAAEVVGLDYPIEHILERISASLIPFLNKRAG
jgi:GntR family transcriptional regulator